MGYIERYKRYKRHFICFKCRKGFKQPNIKDLSEKKGDLSLLMNAYYYSKSKKQITAKDIQYLKEQYFEKPVLCPQCHTPMKEVSKNFEVPPMREIRLWKNLEKSIKMLGFVSENGIKTKYNFLKLLEECRNYRLNMLQNPQSYKQRKESLSQYRNRISQEIKCIDMEIKKLKS